MAAAILVGVAFALAASSTAEAATPAEQLVGSTFSYVADEGHDLHLPAGAQTSPDEPGERFFKFTEGGQTVHAYAYGPFAFEGTDGQVRSVDTDLVALAGGGWRPKSVPFAVTLPSDLGTGVIWQDAGTGQQVRIYPQNVNGTPGHPMAGTSDTIIYEEAWNRTHMTLAVTADGVKDHIILSQANGVPSLFKFRVERPVGARTELRPDGGVSVVAADGLALAQLPAPVARDRDLQEFRIWYEVVQHSGFDVIELHYDTSPITAEGVTTTFEAPFDLDPAIYSGSIVHGVNAFRETSLNAYTVSDIVNGDLRANLLKPPAVAPAVSTYPAGKFARWWITTPPAGSQWYSFSARIEGRVGVTQKYTLHDDTGVRYTFGPAGAAGTYFTQDVSFTPAGYLNSRIEATADSTPLYDYYGTLTNAVAIYEDLVDPSIEELSPGPADVSEDVLEAVVSFSDGQSGCASATLEVLTQTGAQVRSSTGNGCELAASWNGLDEGTYTLRGTVRDRSGRTSVLQHNVDLVLSVSPPSEVADTLGVADEEDTDWTSSGNSLFGIWDAVDGAAGYEYCFSSETVCSGAIVKGWTNNGLSTRASALQVQLASGTRYYLCARAIAPNGARTSAGCSNGVAVDTTPPSPPTAVRDGATMGADVARTPETFTTQGNWDSGADNGELAGYHSCTTPIGEVCRDEDWQNDEADPAARVATHDLALDLGKTMSFCVRSVDAAGNVSAATCSDGQRVMPSELEVNQLTDDRADLGLPASDQLSRSLLTSPPSAGYAETFGIVTTVSEDVRLREEVAASQDVSNDADVYAARFGNAYAGTYVTKNQVVVVRFTKDLPVQERHIERLSAMRACASRGPKSHRKCPARVHFKLAKYSLSSLETLAERIGADAPTIKRNYGIEIHLVYADVLENDVNIEVAAKSRNGVNKARSVLQKLYGGGRPIDVLRSGGAMHDTAAKIKLPWVSRSTYFYYFDEVASGSEIHSEYQGTTNGQTSWYQTSCSAGFSVTANGVAYMLTAAHCVPEDPAYRWKVWSGWNWSPDVENTTAAGFEREIGDFRETKRLVNYDVVAIPFRDTDTGALRPDRRSENVALRGARFKQPPRMQVGTVQNPVVRPTIRRAPGVTGNLVCKSGAAWEGRLGRSGFACKPLVAINAYGCDDTGRCSRQDIALLTSCGGDSGAGMYWFSDLTSPTPANKMTPIGIVKAGLGTPISPTQTKGLDCNKRVAYAPLTLAFDEFRQRHGWNSIAVYDVVQ